MTPSRRSFLLAAAFSTAAGTVAQVPTKCVEIESILVDACNPNTICPGASEGQNEMVRFRTGPEALNLVDLQFIWPNNPWRGFIQTPQTAALTAQLNSTIVQCGWLVEPPAGVIPPGSIVILVTSVDMCVFANSFANLTDTVYLTFQATGNLANHFNNHNNGTVESPVPVGPTVLQTTILEHMPTNCADTASYDRSQLVNENGLYGGPMLINNGAAADFSWPGVPVVTYYNNGCQAPVNPLLIDADVSGPICDGGTVQLTGMVSGSYSTAEWQGGTGTFADPNALVTSYTAGAGDVGQVVLQLCVTGACEEEEVCIDVIVEVAGAPVLEVTADGPLLLCPGETLTLTASGADDFTWEPGGTGPSIVVTEPGSYTVTGTTPCGESTETIVVESGANVTVTIDGPTEICPGEQVVLTASGANDYEWAGGELTATLVVTEPGTYTVVGTTDCGSDEAAFTVLPGAAPDVSIAGPASICPGESLELTASGADSYLWNTTETSATITITGPGTYTVVGTDACGSDEASIEVDEGTVPEVTISGPTELCGANIELTASGADSYLWNTTATEATITVTEPGIYTVTGTNGCGSSEATIEVLPGELPQVTISGSTEACAGTTVELTANGADNYLWSTTETTATINVTETGTYEVVGTTACGDGQASITVNFIAAPEAAITGDPYLCPVAVLTAVGAGDILWSTGETATTIEVTEVGPVEVTISGACGSATATVQIVESPVTVQMSASPVDGIAPVTVQFGATADPADAGLFWEFGDGATDVGSGPAHTYVEPGVYTVLVTATVGGCTATAQTMIEVFDGPGIDVPNIFTPNGDGQNDVLEVGLRGIASLELSMYNRWGHRVYLMERPRQVWDGRTMAGEMVPPGTYFYVVNATAVNGENFQSQGHVTLLR